MVPRKNARWWLVPLFLIAGVAWAMASVPSAKGSKAAYPCRDCLATPQWLLEHRNDPNVVLVDVRVDKRLDGRFLPGAVRLPWKSFQRHDTVRGVGAVFVGAAEAQEILGRAGIARTDTVVLYDSVARDGGATASYVFWVLDYLGHPSKKILHRGIDGWVEAGGETVAEPARREPVTYQAPSSEIRAECLVDGPFVQSRLGDPYYQILDVRSSEEYLGIKQNTALDGSPLAPGHIPGAYNVDYRSNWQDATTKTLRSYSQLQQLYAGLDPNRAVILYCYTGRRSSFTYFVLRLMGFRDVRLYDASWSEWGNSRFYYPVETQANRLTGAVLEPTAAPAAAAKAFRPSEAGKEAQPASSSGYISCGG
ncbi:thiosulfate/3-mercaptopyruvate sulfurtransferase [Desulfacinum hydrothermale DSM 13146]|uniref:Thiosulfate/3-mercaptopyruvate sulfurtransferase n=1 Tax=Desulfacinum hydrothermale DSM 13146 TaxID=1121390 RepID=A0A1W1XQ31_9BACT|nr:sulfurtransferase [Desulfacinum hydrothermale]SMC25984.1 thiosulfate/3-mercaptopyruvate sulfurtransferase [Desulfacinum hydrothermale DSM 13146]